MKKIVIYLFIAAIFVACSSDGDKKESQSESNGNLSMKEKMAKRFGLTLFELENGIGPIKEKLNLPPVNPANIAKGEKLFDEKCTQCHKLDERYTAPPLRDVTERRSPEYILNMILNPEEMTKRHPEAKKLLAQYANQMTFQNVTLEDAKILLDFFRNAANSK